MIVTQDTSGATIRGGPFASTFRTWADRWRVSGSWAAGSSVTNTVVPGHPLLSNGRNLTVGRGNAWGVNDAAQLFTNFNAFDALPFVGGVMLLDFWILSTSAGLRSVAIQGTAPNQSCVMPFTVRAVNAWQRVTLPFILPSNAVATLGQLVGVVFPINYGSAVIAAQRAPVTNQFTAGLFTLTSDSQPFAPGDNDFIRITDVQIIGGAVLTPYDRVALSNELNRARTWFQMSYSYGTNPGALTPIGMERFTANIVGAGLNQSPTVRFRVPLIRGGVLVTIYNPEIANNQIRRIGAADCTNSLLDLDGTGGFGVQCNGDAGSVIGSPLGFHWVADVGV